MSAIVQATASGEVHGLINTLTNAVQFDDFKYMDPKTKAKVEKEKKDDSRLVKVEFIHRNGRHERLTKPYMRYAGDPIQIWHLIPGHVYELPYGLVKEVNGMKRTKRSGLLEVDGNKVTKDGAPLAQDEDDDWLFKLVPAGFGQM